mgnify:CR=1 FL=1
MYNNNQKGAFYSLNIDNDNPDENYLKIESIPLSSTSNEFSFDIWYYITGKSSQIISQENGLLLGIEEKKFYFSFPGIGKIIIINDVVKFESNEWANIFFSYNNENITVALNGINIYSKEIKNKKLLSTGPLFLGTGFSGYLRSFRIYKKAMKQNDYKTYLFQQTYTNDMADLIGFISFNQEIIQDLSPSNLVINSFGSCQILDCVHVYCSESKNRDGYAKLENSPELNPGGFENGVFSIYAKVYLRPSDNKIETIISNGYIDKQDSIALCTQHVDYNSLKIMFKIGLDDVLVDDVYECYNWLDILVTYNKNNLDIFIDGELKKEFPINNFNRTSIGDVKIGNAFNSQKNKGSLPFDGYISTVAIFDKSLLQTDAMEFFNNQPFIFEDGIKALFCFNTGIACDLVSSTELTLTNQGLIIAPHTVQSINDKPNEYRITKTFPSMSDITKWKCKIIFSAIVSYFENCLGLYFNFKTKNTEDLPPYFLNYIYENFRYKPEFAPIFAEEIQNDTAFIGENKNNVTHGGFGVLIHRHVAIALRSINISQFQGLIRVGAVNTQANVAAGGLAAINGATLAEMTVPFESATTALFLLYAASETINIIVGHIIEKIKQNRENKPKDDDDDPNKKYIVKILELTLQSNPENFAESAVHCKNYSGPINPPEIIRDKPPISSVYIASELKQVKIKAKFQLTVLSKEKKPYYSVSISGYANNTKVPFFNHLSGSGDNFTEGVNFIELKTTEIVNKRLDNIYLFGPTFSWNYTVDGYEDTDSDITFNIYTLPCIPVPPISLDKLFPDNFINLDYLSIFKKEALKGLAAENISVTLTPEFLATVTRNLYNDESFIYEGHESPFIRLDNATGVITFFEKWFNIALVSSPKPILINCITYAVLLKYFINLFGDYDCSILCIKNATPGGTLPVKPNRPARWDHDYVDNFVYHAVVKTTLCTTPITWCIFDASFNFSRTVYKNNMHTMRITPEDAGSYLYAMFQLDTRVTDDQLSFRIDKTYVPPTTSI